MVLKIRVIRVQKMKTLITLLFLTVITFNLSAQQLKVRIVDTNNQPIPNATIYIRETAQGMIADTQGEIQLVLNAGNYTFDISSLGYERKTMQVTIPPEGLSLTIPLTDKIFSLREVVVTPGKEDPAYRVMRHVIARAPYHFHQVKSYTSNIYFKGAFILEKIPALIKVQIKEQEIKHMIGKRMVYESQSEIKYEAPDKYDQQVKALATTIPQGMTIFDDSAPIVTMMMNIYDPKILGGLMKPGSFSVYKFKLEEIYDEGNYQIYKIRIIPRKNNGQLVSGHLYIVDDTWTIQQANLRLAQAGITMNLHLVYNEVKPGAFLVSAYDLNMDMSILGFKGNGQFYASIKYNDLETNDTNILAKAEKKPEITEQKPLTAKQQKDIQKIEELANKEKLTTRESYKMAQLIEKTVEPEEAKEQRKSLEIKQINTGITVTRDSLALFQDSTFCVRVRVQPLRDDELKSYLQRDSLQLLNDSLKSADSIKNRTLGKWLRYLLLGEKINIGKKFYFSYNGLLFACQEYNFVDGFRIGQRLETGINFNKTNTLAISPAIYFTTARKEVDFVINSWLTYAPFRNGRLSLSAGNTVSDHAGRNGTSRYGNTLSTILYAGNTAKFYQKQFASITNQVDLANGLHLTTGFNYEKRNDLENKTSWNLMNKEPNTNRPHGWDERMPEHEAYVASIGLQFTPRYYYSVWEGRKQYRRSDYPTFRLRYNKGFAGKSRINSSFENIETSFFHSIRLNLFSSLFYSAGGGMFLSSEKTYLPDYIHFMTNEMFLTGKSFNVSFTMDNYRYATNDKWLQGFVTCQSQYILLKQLPFLQRYLFDEAVHLKAILTPNVNFIETGYSIGLGEAGRIGVFFYFQKQKYDGFGVALSLPFLL